MTRRYYDAGDAKIAASSAVYDSCWLSAQRAVVEQAPEVECYESLLVWMSRVRQGGVMALPHRSLTHKHSVAAYTVDLPTAYVILEWLRSVSAFAILQSLIGDVAKLADAIDLGSIVARRESSSLSVPTITDAC
jgi:hypothetical protein